MEITKGCLVRCLCGHDAGVLHFAASDVCDGFVLLIDGKGRTTDTPKRKNARHVAVVSESVEGVSALLRAGEKVKNSDIRKIIAAIVAKDFEEGTKDFV